MDKYPITGQRSRPLRLTGIQGEPRASLVNRANLCHFRFVDFSVHRFLDLKFRFFLPLTTERDSSKSKYRIVCIPDRTHVLKYPVSLDDNLVTLLRHKSHTESLNGASPGR